MNLISRDDLMCAHVVDSEEAILKASRHDNVALLPVAVELYFADGALVSSLNLSYSFTSVDVPDCH